MAETDALTEEIVATLARRAETVATAESLTAGSLCAKLTEVPGASAVVRGGLIVYATELKSSLAGVDPDKLARLGPVHPEIAESLADGARRNCGASWGLGLTGVAGPEPQGGVDAGTVYIAIVGSAVRTTRAPRLRGQRADVRHGTVQAALELLREQLTGN